MINIHGTIKKIFSFFFKANKLFVKCDILFIICEFISDKFYAFLNWWYDFAIEHDRCPICLSRIVRRDDHIDWNKEDKRKKEELNIYKTVGFFACSKAITRKGRLIPPCNQTNKTCDFYFVKREWYIDNWIVSRHDMY